MATVPKQTKCAMLGCKHERSKLNSYCLDHGGVDVYIEKKSAKRKEFNDMYSQSGWRKLRVAQLSKQPLCQGCLTSKHIRQADTVDHLFSWNHIGKEAFFNNVFQSLCAECHADKSNLEWAGVYRRYHDNTYTDYRIEQYKSVLSELKVSFNAACI